MRCSQRSSRLSPMSATRPCHPTPTLGESRSDAGGGRLLVGVLDLLAGADPDLVTEPDQRVEVPVGDALLQRDDGVVSDVNVFRAHLGAALGDVAEPGARILRSGRRTLR